MSGAIECPVFQATHRDLQSQSFAEYVESKEPEFREAGVCRIVAPRGWKPRRAGYGGANFLIPRPIRQHATGRQGLYRTILVEQKALTLRQFKAMADDPLNAPPANQDTEALERKYWKNVAISPPIYGADVPGSLFDEDCKFWNLRHLDSLLSRTMAEHGVEIPGVNTPYLYVGSWRSTFAWHTEDLDLHSVNYLHFGSHKSWYVVPPAHRARFERLMQGLLPDVFRVCPEFLRHKELVVSPSLLQAHNIPVVRVEQHPGEFVVTYPGAYHCGFNQGFNCAESVNFATKSWVDVGAVAGSCECRQDTVRMDMRMFADYMSPALREEWLASDSSGSESDSESGEEGSSSDEEEGASGSSGGESSSQEEERESSDEEEEMAAAAAPRRRGRHPSRRAARARKRPWSPEQSPAPRGLAAKRQRGQEQPAQRPRKRAVPAAAEPPPQLQQRPSRRAASQPRAAGAAAVGTAASLPKKKPVKPAGPDRGQRLQQRQQRAGTYFSPRAERLLLRAKLQQKQAAAAQEAGEDGPSAAPSRAGRRSRLDAPPAHAAAAPPEAIVAAAAAAEPASAAVQGEDSVQVESARGSLRSDADSVDHAGPSGALKPGDAGAEEDAPGGEPGHMRPTRNGGPKQQQQQHAGGKGPAPGGGRRLLGMVTSVLPQLGRMRGAPE